ncbi:MAG: hypothetical protein JKY96_04485 [Phycisphaerales bacterium]|nr:hypothetical protein [Phycisphaerales bacterium]
MFGFLGSLFGSKAAGERIIDGVSKAADKLFYTSEEKAEDSAKARSKGYQVYMKWLESTTGSRLARRFIALMVTGLWVVEHVSAIGLQIASVFSLTPANLIEAGKILSDSANNNNALVGVVLLFYFGGPAAMEGTKGLVNKWVGSKTIK